MPTSPGPLLAALTALWERLRTTVEELPPAVLTISPSPLPTDHGPGRWSLTDDGVLVGLTVTADTLREGAEQTVRAVLHDAAHVLAWRRGIKDTTMRGAYHNRNFLVVADEVGLYWPEGRPRRQATEWHGGRGFSDPELSDEARHRHEADIAVLTDVIPQALPHLTAPAARSNKPRPDRLTLQCGCPEPRKMRMSRTVAARAPVICGACKEEFKEA